MRRRVRVVPPAAAMLLPVLAVVLLLVATVTGGAGPARAATAGQRYVALGDSYAAGLGIDPALAGAPAGCGRSARNYPHQLAAALGLSLTDVTCSGATTADLAGAQKAGGTIVAPQLDALTPDTALVTLTIGGNDLGFGSIASTCASLSGPNGPVAGGQPTCRATYVTGGTDTLAARLRDRVAPALADALARIRAAAPGARVVVVDYPALTPDAADVPSGGCWSSPLDRADALPLTAADLPYLQGVQAALDAALAAAATAHGASTSSVYRASLAHTACSDAPWVHGVTLSGLAVAGSSLHPTLVGATAVATAAVPVARAALAGRTVPPPPPAAARPSGGGLSGAAWAGVAVAAAVVLIVALGVLRVRRRTRTRA